MSWYPDQHGQNQQPSFNLGATFVPGGFDDYYMPAPALELVSPAPQRIMPEVPEQIQDGIQHLELEANQARTAPAAAPTQPLPQQPRSYRQQSSAPEYHTPSQHSNGSYNKPDGHPQRQSSLTQWQGTDPAAQSQTAPPCDYKQIAKAADMPNFSPFPQIKNRRPNVAPSYEELEAQLENARPMVLNTNDPEVQLAWAQDALAYVDVSMLHEDRMAEIQPRRAATPRVEHQLRVDAMNIVSFLADQHHPRAEFMRGMWLEFGKFGQRMDKREAFMSYKRAAERGYVRAEYRMGMQYEQSNDAQKALTHYKAGAAAGDSASNYRLGMMTLLGQHGQPQDFGKGVQLIRQSAANADENAPQGAYVLGMLQARELPQIQVPEIFLPYDEKAARENIERAAFLGFAKAQLKMGSAHELCTLGCEFSPELSLHYNALAARQGEPEAEMAISKWFLCGYEGVFEKNEELAYTYARRAAQAGLPTAEFAMGYFNEIGMYVPVNLDKAMEWYEKAAKAGNKDAVGRIEGISKQRTLSRKDHEQVAISKIRSQYGSRRGSRPDRFKTPAPPLPAIPDSASDFPTIPLTQSVQMPQPTITSPAGARPPPRHATTTPYPIEDRPPVISPLERPATVAPYPLDNGPPSIAGRPGPAGGFFRPELRSASAAPMGMRPPPGSAAFNINPNILAPPAHDNRPIPAGGRGSMSPRDPRDGPMPLRPFTTVGNASGGPGYPPQGRIASGPPIAPGGPQGYRQPGGPSVERPERIDSAPPPQSKPSEPPRVDIGFSAPADDRRGRLQKPGNPNVNKAQQRQPDLGFQAPKQPPSPVSARTSRVQGPVDRPPTTRPVGERPGSRPGSRPSSRPPSRPSSAGQGQPPRQEQKPQPQAQAQTPAKTSAKTDPAAAPKPATPAVARPPGTGPKTFDEMGVGKPKDESDCIVM
ncbi:hypothetical protein H2201_007573 [Coniosporium apollinis]|uniref:HCP-like protein n=1 Tax=Coniosporium apollinis TaxID=61459 RepID=A0ABQ9NJC5_9PEZI|nr:hypothetical protein H2201_007573 [Coniosporium apollinis]